MSTSSLRCENGPARNGKVEYAKDCKSQRWQQGRCSSNDALKRGWAVFAQHECGHEKRARTNSDLQGSKLASPAGGDQEADGREWLAARLALECNADRRRDQDRVVLNVGARLFAVHFCIA